MKYRLLINKATKERKVLNTETGVKVSELENPSLYLELRKIAVKNAKNRQWASMKKEAMESIGLVSYRTESGALRWE